MDEKTTDGKTNEQALVKLYMELTGRTESDARSVLMYVDSPEVEADDESGSNAIPLAKS